MITGPADFIAVKDALEAAGFQAEFAEVTMKPEGESELTGDDAVGMQKLLDALEGLDDVRIDLHHRRHGRLNARRSSQGGAPAPPFSCARVSTLPLRLPGEEHRLHRCQVRPALRRTPLLLLVRYLIVIALMTVIALATRAPGRGSGASGCISASPASWSMPSPGGVFVAIGHGAGGVTASRRNATPADGAWRGGFLGNG